MKLSHRAFFCKHHAPRGCQMTGCHDWMPDTHPTVPPLIVIPGPASPEPGIVSIASKSRTTRDAPGPDLEIPGSPIRRPGMTERWKADVMIDAGHMIDAEHAPPRLRTDAADGGRIPTTWRMDAASSPSNGLIVPGCARFGLQTRSDQQPWLHSRSFAVKKEGFRPPEGSFPSAG